MTIDLAPLPYPLDGLAPHISERTLSFHHGRHHAGYVANLNRMIEGTAHEGSALEDIVAAAEVPSGLFNNAAQAWNHGGELRLAGRLLHRVRGGRGGELRVGVDLAGGR